MTDKPVMVGKVESGVFKHEPWVLGDRLVDPDGNPFGVPARAQMNNCGSHNVNGVTEVSPLALPFGAGVSSPPLTIDSPGVFLAAWSGDYLLSYHLVFHAVNATSLGACFQWSMTGLPGSWSDLSMTKSFGVAVDVNNADSALDLPPVELNLGAGTFLRVVVFQTGMPFDAHINGVAGLDRSWARAQGFHVVAP